MCGEDMGDVKKFAVVTAKENFKAITYHVITMVENAVKYKNVGNTTRI
jgi:hypothetical protein